MGEVMKATIPIFTFLIDDKDRIYLQRRYQTGYLDGFYEPPAGKMDVDEFPKQTAVRELMEEAGVVVDQDDLEYFHAYMNNSNHNPWFGVMFRTRRWQGEPSIQEPHKCDDAGFFSLDKLPNLTPQVTDAVSRLTVASTIDICEYDNINTQP